jgi:hypothetical protein
MKLLVIVDFGYAWWDSIAMQEYTLECPRCPELYVTEIRWTVCPLHGLALVPFSPAPAPGVVLQPHEESPGPMSYVKFDIAVEAKKVVQGRKTKANEYVLLRLLSEEYLRTSK